MTSWLLEIVVNEDTVNTLLSRTSLLLRVNKLLCAVDAIMLRRSSYELNEADRELRMLEMGAQLTAREAVIEAIAAWPRASKCMQISGFMDFALSNSQRSYSQWCQDLFVMWALDDMQGGRYVEIGGADGVTHSNTLALQRTLGWSGTLVEPDPQMFKVLKQTRGTVDTVRQAAIAPDGGVGTGVLRRMGQLSSLTGWEGDDMHAEMRRSSSDLVSVELIDIHSVLALTGRIDYLSLDVEGAELDIIEGIDWTRVEAPRVITVEHNFREAQRLKMLGLLSQRGYREVFPEQAWLTRGDLWMAHRDVVLPGDSTNA